MNKILKSDRTVIANRLWFLVGLTIFILLFFALTKEMTNRRQINKRISEYEAAVEKLKSENAALNDKISNWDTSGELEMNARVKLGLEKPGEQTIVIRRSAPPTGEMMAVKTNQEMINLAAAGLEVDSQANAVKWWNYFFQ